MLRQVVNTGSVLKDRGALLIERRTAKRFRVNWPIRVEGGVDAAGCVVLLGALRNISSGGALMSLPKALSEGTAIDVFIKLPLRGEKWMKYPARVVRVRPAGGAEVAVRFDQAAPEFKSPPGGGF